MRDKPVHGITVTRSLHVAGTSADEAATTSGIGYVSRERNVVKKANQRIQRVPPERD